MREIQITNLHEIINTGNTFFLISTKMEYKIHLYKLKTHNLQVKRFFKDDK